MIKKPESDMEIIEDEARKGNRQAKNYLEQLQAEGEQR